MSCCNCIRGPIGPQGPQGPQGPTTRFFFASFRETSIGPTDAFKLRTTNFRGSPDSNNDIINLGYQFKGDLIDLEKIRIVENASVKEDNRNIWTFSYFFSEPTKTTITLKYSIIIHIPSSSLNNLEDDNYITVENHEDEIYKIHII
jgi:hypothetical protein